MERVEKIRSAATHIVLRSCGFALLAIMTTCMGFVDRPEVAARVAAIGASLLACLLIWQSHRVPRTNWRHSEIWVWARNGGWLPTPETQAARIFSNILIETYWRFARITALGAVALWGMAGLLWWLAGT